MVGASIAADPGCDSCATPGCAAPAGLIPEGGMATVAGIAACGGAAGRGAGIGSLDFDATIACSTLADAAGVPPGGVRRDGRGLRSSLTAGAWILAASAAGGGALIAGRAGLVGWSREKS